MSKLANQLDADLKKSMLAGDKQLTSVLKGLKSALQYARVETGTELSDEEAVKVFQKESKKRAEAIKLYEQAGDNDRSSAETYEKQVIDAYLPEVLGEEEVKKLVDGVVEELGEITQQSMGQVISQVMQKSAGRADGATVARLVKERIDR